MSEIKIRDIDGLQNRIDRIDVLTENIVYGPFTFGIGVATSGLSVGYAGQIIDPSYNFDVDCDARMTKSLDIFGNLQVDKTLLVNSLTTLNTSCIIKGDLIVNRDSYLERNVSVLGKTFLNQTLDVSGNTSLGSQLFVNASAVFNDNVSILGKTFLNRTLDVSGNTSLGAQLFVNASSVFNDNVSILGKTFLNRTLDVSGNTSLGSQLFVNASSVFNDNVSVLGKTFLNRTLDVSGNTSLWSQLFVNASSVFNDNVSILGKTFLNRTLDVSGNTSLWSQLFVNASAVFNDNVSVLGKTTLSKDLNILGNTQNMGTLGVTGKTTLNQVLVEGIVTLNKNVNILSETTIDTNLYVGNKATLANASVNNQTDLNHITVVGNTILNGPVDINNKATLNDLEVFDTTTLKGSVFTVNATSITLDGAIIVPPNNSFKVNGNLEVDTLRYKALINDNTSAQLYVSGNAITQLEVADFTGKPGNEINNMSGAALFKANVKFKNSSTYQTTIQFGENGSSVKMVTYSDHNSETFLNGKLNVNTSSYNTGGFDYTGPFTIRGDNHTIYSTTTNLSSNTTNIKGNVNIYNQLRICSGGSILVDSPDTTIIDLKKIVQISTQLNVSNNGTGPAIRASQASPHFAEIMLLEADGLDVYSVGNMGNTQIRGKVRLGYDVVSSSNTKVNDVPGDIQLVAGQTPFLDYQLDVSGSCIVYKNMDVNGNMSVNGTTYMNGLLTLKNDLTSYSDRRIKKNIIPLMNCLDKITTIHGYTFQRIDRNDEKVYIGMIAQEIEEPFPELVHEIEDNGTKIKTINYPAFTSVLLECIQELKERITILENKILR